MSVYVITFIFAVVFCGYCSGIETGFIRVSPVQLNKLQKKGVRQAERLAKLLAEKEEILASILIGNNVSIIISSAVATSFLINYIHLQEQGSFFATIVVTPLLLVFGEIFPKTLFLHNSLPKVLFLTPLLAFFRLLFFPIIRAMTLFTNFIFKHLIPNLAKSNELLSREDILLLLSLMKPESSIQKKEQLYISRLFRFQRTLAKEAMKPLLDITTLKDTATMSELLSIMESTGFSRIPIYKENIDNIVGIIHAKDALMHCTPSQLLKPIAAQLLRPVTYVPETKRISSLLAEFQKRHQHSAIVIDEYGAPVGLLTIEDILEEIFGEIYD
ncbi:hemolysin family protein, partial [candidate division CSSED10-310 bacterium]